MKQQIIAAACALGLAASPIALLAQQSQAGGQSPAAAGAGLPQAPLTEEGKEFITKAAEGNLAEVVLAGTAKTNASSDNVRQFAERLLNDHASANETLQGIAKSHGMEWPKEPREDARELAARLDKMSGAEFDKTFMEEMVKDHEKDVKEYKEAREKVQNPQLQAYIDNTLDTLEAHLVLARAVRDGVESGAAGSDRQSRAGD